MELFKKDYPTDRLCVAALRSLVIDETNHAKSGHPGMALDIAPTLYVLFKNHLVANPEHPEWLSRDRFVLSSGHNSALLYAMLHLSGYGVSMDDLKAFRTLNSITPGHPEVGLTPGVDATAGPLGQGIAQAVGMAVAEEHIAASYPEGKSVMSHYTYCLCGDGCLEEGLSQEAISFAGHQKLNKLILIYDANTSTLDGPTSNTMTEDVKERFLSAEWNVLEVKDGNDLDQVDRALSKAKESVVYPSIIIVHTIIGFGSVNQGSHKTHGEPLGEEDGKHCKEVYGYAYPEFTVPEEVYDQLRKTFAERGKKAYSEWAARFTLFQSNHPKESKVFIDAFARNVAAYLPKMPTFDPSTIEATRVSSGHIVSALPLVMPFTLGGSADVAGSLKTAIAGDPGFSKEHPEAKNINFGIREFAMASIQNGMLLHGGIVSYIGSFLIFTDYMKAAVRMSALEKLPAIYLFSHDSIAIGEDGPTHEPVEQMVGFRAIPNVHLYRPADARETYAAWKAALLSSQTPTILVLTRQNLPLLAHSSEKGVEKGGYVLEANPKKRIQLLATGSEVSLCLAIQKILLAKGVESEVVSLPCLEVFDKQSKEYQSSKSFRFRKRSVIASRWARDSAGTNMRITSSPLRSSAVRRRAKTSSRRWAGPPIRWRRKSSLACNNVAFSA
jgi:transketolase